MMPRVLDLLRRCHAACALVLIFLLVPAWQVSANVRDRVVVVTAGDTFAAIALREFGTSSFARLVAEYNALSYRDELRIGQLIRIPLAARNTQQVADVFFAKGGSLISPAGAGDQAELLRTGSQVYKNDVITTDANGYVSMRFPSGAVVSVQPNSIVQVTELDCVTETRLCLLQLNATAGKVQTNINRQLGDTELRIVTPHAAAAVRGTRFDVDADDDRILVGVTQGEVEVTARGRATGLLQGLGVRTAAGEFSDPPVRLLNAPDIRRLPVRVSVEDTLRWRAINGAVSYLVAMSEDADGAVNLYQVESTELAHSINTLAAGGYFLGIRAVDASGFTGFRNSEAVTVVELDEEQPVVTLLLSGADDQRILTINETADLTQDVEVQLSTFRSFEEVSSVDVPRDGGVLFQAIGVPQYARARVIVDAESVGSFGPVIELPAQ